MILGIIRKVVHKAVVRVYGVTSRITAARVPEAHEALAEEPIALAEIERGSPAAKTHLISRSGDGGLVTGIWECTAGTFHWYFACDEIVHVLDGEAYVEHEGRTIELVPGTVAFFPIGAKTRWNVPRRVRKVFIHRRPTPMVERALDALGSIALRSLRSNPFASRRPHRA